MNIVNLDLLDKAMRRHVDAKPALEAWLEVVQKARWHGSTEIKQNHATASFLRENVVIFNIRGNHYRLVAKIYYPKQTVLLKWFGTHAEYDKQRF